MTPCPTVAVLRDNPPTNLDRRSLELHLDALSTWRREYGRNEDEQTRGPDRGVAYRALMAADVQAVDRTTEQVRAALAFRGLANGLGLTDAGREDLLDALKVAEAAGKVQVQIAPSSGALYEVRLIGPGGWRTLHHGDLSSCRSDARATAQVLRLEFEDVPDPAPARVRTFRCTSGLREGTCSCYACHGG